MRCPKCQSMNREGVKFCEDCGAPMERQCPSCGALVPPGKKFCGGCGSKLAELPSPLDPSRPASYTPKHLADQILTSRSALEGEKKLVTVLFADVANFTSLSEKLDPEEVHQIMDGCFQILMQEIHRYEGTVNQFTGDGVMALFGAPLAHEDHAQRACHAALAIQKAMEGYGERIQKQYGLPFQLRIGLNSGPVVVGKIGDDLRMDYTAIGDTTNLAARIQQNAKPGEAWISEETHRIARDYFHEEAVGELPLKGKEKPQPLYHLLSELAGMYTRMEAGVARGMTDLVGRGPEMEALQFAFARVQQKEAQLVDIVGEAGVGKSRLVFEFRKPLGDQVTFLSGFCIPYGRNISFLPVIDLIKGAFGIEEGMTVDQVGQRIEEKASPALASKIPFYRNLLSLPVDDPTFNALDPEGRKFGTFEAVKDFLLAQSQAKPLVLFLEDVHWMDKISEEFFAYFSRCFASHPILILTAYRPETSPPWAQGSHCQRVVLETLNPSSSAHLVRNLLGGLELDPDLQQKIADKAGGNPFFLEEIVRELKDRGDLVQVRDRYLYQRPLSEIEIPNTIQSVLAARMDRLSEDLKRTLQVASVIGRDFAFRLLKTILDIGEELRGRLKDLVGLEIIYEKALYPELEYIFKHALTQKVAYESLLKQRRREIHGRIARTIEELYSERVEERYEILAHHYERSGDVQKAVHYLLLAGEKSNRLHAVHAAHEFFGNALELAKNEVMSFDPETKVRLHHGKALSCYAMGDVAEAAEEFQKAIELCQSHGLVNYERSSLQKFLPLMQYNSNKEEAEKAYQGGIARARELNDKGMEGYILAVRGQRVAMDGQPYEGYQMVVEGERLAKEAGDLRWIAVLRIVQAYTEKWLDRSAKAVELTEGLLEDPESSSPVTHTFILFVRGLALAETGRIDEGISTIKCGIDIGEKFGALFYLPAFYNCLGYCYGEIYQPERAWTFNLKGEQIARYLMETHPVGSRHHAEMLAQSSVNLMENLFDQGRLKEAWDRMQSLKGESKGPDFERLRHQWESRMNYLTAQIYLARGNLAQAEPFIRENLEIVRRLHSKKREGGFLRLLGEVQMRRDAHEEALQSFNQAIALLQEVGNPRQLWQAYASLASAYEQMGRIAEAKAQWGTAAELIHGLANGLSDRELREGFLQATPIQAILSKRGSP
jgi:class 3 adenylate cyclase/tetratricopeptide (TPR) repeat protein